MNPDQAIDRVLTALATTEAPPEMKQRVLSTLHSGATMRQDARRQGTAFPLLAFVTPKNRHRPWAIAAGLIILSLAASVAVRRRHNPLHADVPKQHTSPQSSPVQQVAEAQSAHRTHQYTFATLQQTKDVAAPGEDINDLDALAIIEMNAPSKPAPPLPLSHQERLLAGAAQQPDRVELSSLRPEVRAREMELSKAEFHDFFEPPPAAKDNE